MFSDSLCETFIERHDVRLCRWLAYGIGAVVGVYNFREHFVAQSGIPRCSDESPDDQVRRCGHNESTA